MEAIFKAQTQTDFQQGHIYGYKHNQLRVFSASIESESINHGEKIRHAESSGRNGKLSGRGGIKKIQEPEFQLGPGGSRLQRLVDKKINIIPLRSRQVFFSERYYYRHGIRSEYNEQTQNFYIFLKLF